MRVRLEDPRDRRFKMPPVDYSIESASIGYRVGMWNLLHQDEPLLLSWHLTLAGAKRRLASIVGSEMLDHPYFAMKILSRGMTEERSGD